MTFPNKEKKIKTLYLLPMSFIFDFLFYFLLFLVLPSNSTIDINLAEYQYIADHLTEEECYRLVAALHFRSFELPKEINAAERRLPEDVPCINLLLHWNSTPKEGKGQTHVEVCHRLNQIGREDLAQWLSKNVFHEISGDVKNILNSTLDVDYTLSYSSTTEFYLDEKVQDEATWGKVDSIISILIIFGIVTLSFQSFYLCYVYCSKKP